MDLLNMARDLGYAIQSDPDYIDFKIKEQNVECDEELQKIIENFKLKKVDINHEISKENSDTQKIDKLNKEIAELYNSMVSHETMKLYNESKEKFNSKLQKVSMIINKSAMGEDPYLINADEGLSCSGSCDSCGGCRE